MHTPDINFLRQRQDRYSPVPSERSAVSSSVSSGLLGGVNAILIGVAISFLLLGAYAIADFTFRRRLATLEEEQSTVTQDLASAQAELGQLRSLETELSAINDRTQAFQSFFNDVQPWSAILEDIRNQTPPDVWLTSISADSNTVNIAGQATRFQSVNDFQLTLLQSPLIANAVLESAVLSEDEENEGIGVSWTTRCVWISPVAVWTNCWIR
ncbi:MAG: PilN domain-containing protein [Cyanobacteria bacterium J06642_12]